MALGRSEIVANPRLQASIAGQSRALIAKKKAAPKLASIMATRQRWYMAHTAAAACYESSAAVADRGVLIQALIDSVVRHDVASRNTAAAFYRECLRYGVLEYVPGSEGKRYRPVNLTQFALQGLSYWVLVHVSALDVLDDGGRAAALRSDPDTMSAVHPLIAAGLLASAYIRRPGPIYDLFAWVNEGGLIMDRLIVGMEPGDPYRDRIPVDVTSISQLAEGLNLSRTHLGRTLGTAEQLGCLGWIGAKGKSQLWISSQFRRDYYEAQAEKLAIVDAACEAVLFGARADRDRIAI